MNQNVMILIHRIECFFFILEWSMLIFIKICIC